MICSQCGSPILEGSRFCQKCGAPVQEQPSSPPQAPQPTPPTQPAYQPYAQPPYGQQPYGVPPYPGAPQPKNKKTGLVIGLIAGAVVLIGAALALYFFVFSGTSVAGQWYCEERGQVLVFSGEDTISGYSLTGTVEGQFDFDKSRSEGTITANGTELSFKVEKNVLILTDDQNDDESAFAKVDSKSDPEELVLSALQGLWSSEEIGEVLEFKDGTVNVYSGYGDFNGTYDYDIDKGQGTFTTNGTAFEFFADYNALSVTDTGNYVKADKNLDITAFVAAHAMPIAGLWYDTSGTYGTIEFNTDGTAQLIMFDQPLTATYTFDIATGTGTFSTESTGQTSTMTYIDGTIEIDGIRYSKEAVEQLGAEDLPSVTGTWYETTGYYGDLTLSEDGSVVITMGNNYVYGTYTYDVLSQTGSMEMEIENSTETWDFTCDGDALKVGDYTYTRDYVSPVSTAGITGIWYDVAGQSGTATFYDDNSLLFDCYGNMLTGTYTYDPIAGTGTVSISDSTDPYNGTITFDGTYLYFDSIQYTRDFVAQPDYSGQ